MVKTNSEIEKNLLLQKVVNNIPSMIGYWDKDLKNKFCNAAYEDFFLMKSEEIYNKHISEVLGQEIYEKNLIYITEALKGNQQVFERVLTKNGIKKITQAIYIPDVEDEVVHGFYVLVNDITEIRLMEEERNGIYQKMIQSSKMVALGEMASGIAHEINNPLSSVSMNANFIIDLLDEEKIDSNEIKKYISKILYTVNKVGKIITGLHFFSQDRTDDLMVSASVSHIVDETLSFCLQRIKSLGINLTQPKIDLGLRINCRPTQISQVLLNLLNNAVDAVKDHDSRWISIIVIDKINELEIQIADSGPKLNPEFFDKIFQPFFTTKEAGKGTGLGLSISKGIIESHEGTLTLDKEAKNTTFIITLPKKYTSVVK